MTEETRRLAQDAIGRLKFVEDRANHDSLLLSEEPHVVAGACDAAIVAIRMLLREAAEDG